jgi:hypothetical protein
MPADGHSVPRKPVVVRLGQAGMHIAAGTVWPTLPGQSLPRFHTPAFCARRRAVATAPGFVVDAITGWIKAKRLEDPAPQNVASRL